MFRHIARKSWPIQEVFPAIFRQSDENSDYASCAPELCGIALIVFLLLEATAILIEFAVFANGGFLLQRPIAVAEFCAGKLRIHGLSFVFHSFRSFSYPAGNPLFQSIQLKPVRTNVIIVLQSFSTSAQRNYLNEVETNGTENHARNVP
jgi:hypothetical protein